MTYEKNKTNDLRQKRQDDEELLRSLNNENIANIELCILRNAFKNYMKLLKFLYDEHREILREHEKRLGLKISLHFLAENL